MKFVVDSKESREAATPRGAARVENHAKLANREFWEVEAVPPGKRPLVSDSSESPGLKPFIINKIL
ncbi:hypothetical protein [Halalkalibacillus sediminis]|uniref:hypothetical protein n=1 Tax=Halalkalibacillus sediminis TaxID=2018042 RepID=UPI001EE41DBC|nr:hypothetical protein [Halalkalibacillus sediminis]